MSKKVIIIGFVVWLSLLAPRVVWSETEPAENAKPRDSVQAEINSKSLDTYSYATFRKWPTDRPIRVRYRIVGSYRTLMRQLQPAINRRNGVLWGPPLDALAEVDVEKLLNDKLVAFGRLAGLQFSLEKENWWDDWLLSAKPADFKIQFYLSDRYADARAFAGLQSLHKRVGQKSDFMQTFIPWGWVGTYSKRQALQGAACLATYSAMTFREELALGLAFTRGLVGRTRPGLLILRPFEKMLTDYWFGGLGIFFEHSGPRTRGSGGINKYLKKSESCRTKFQNAYASRWSSIIDSCLSSALGLPVNNVTIRSLLDDPEKPALSDLNALEFHSLGSKEWVRSLGYQVVERHPKSEYFLAARSNFKEIIPLIYARNDNSQIREAHRVLKSRLPSVRAPINDHSALYRSLLPCFLGGYRDRKSDDTSAAH